MDRLLTRDLVTGDFERDEELLLLLLRCLGLVRELDLFPLWCGDLLLAFRLLDPWSPDLTLRDEVSGDHRCELLLLLPCFL